MPELSEKSRLGSKVVVRRTRRRTNNLSRGLPWRNRKRSRRASYGRVLYNYHRTYDPSTGRYLESDPIGLAAGLNTYAYVGNMPTMRIDPFGLFEIYAHQERGGGSGWQTYYKFEFNPISGDPSDIAQWFSKTARRLDAATRWIDTEPVGPRKPYEDFLACGQLDVELEKSFDAWFKGKDKLTGDEAREWLDAMQNRHSEFNDLYPSPKNMLEQAEVNSKAHWFYRIRGDDSNQRF